MNRSKYETPKGNDDLYSGYNEFNSAFSTKDIEQDAYIQEALKTSYGNRPGVVNLNLQYIYMLFYALD